MFDSAVMEEGLGQAEAAMRESMPPPQGFAGSPDGLGAFVHPDGSPGTQLPPQQHHDPMPMQPQPGIPYSQVPHTPIHGELDFIEPDDTSGGAAMRSGGMTLLLVAVSAGAGYAWRGGWGATAGLLLSAGVANGYRAQKWWGSADPGEKHEAVVSGLFALAEIFGGGFVAYKASKEPAKA